MGAEVMAKKRIQLMYLDYGMGVLDTKTGKRLGYLRMPIGENYGNKEGYFDRKKLGKSAFDSGIDKRTFNKLAKKHGIEHDYRQLRGW